MNVQVAFVPQDDERWLTFLSDSRPTLFQTPRWCGIMAEEYGFAARVAVALNDSGRVVAGLPYAEVEDFRGHRRVAYAFSDLCDPLGDLGAWPAIESALSLAGVPWQIRSCIAPNGEQQVLESPGVVQSLTLPSTMAEATRAFHEKQRVNARRFERAGGICRKVTDASFFEPFYELFARLRKHKFRLLPQSRSFFKRLAASYFPERGFALMAELNGQVLAAMLLLAEGETLYYKYGASDAEAGKVRPSNFLFQKAVEEAIAGGFRQLNLGISNEPGLQRFKRHLGAVSLPYYVARYNQRPKSEAVVSMENALGTMTRILTEPDVPLSAAVSAGEALYRYFV